MTDRFFAEIEDERERRVTEAAWRAIHPDGLMPEDVMQRWHEPEARHRLEQVRANQTRPFLDMLDAALTMPEDEHEAMMERLNKEAGVTFTEESSDG